MQLIQKVQSGIKTGSQSLSEFAFRLVSGLFLGLTLTLIGQELVGYGNFAFWFVIVLTTTTLVKMTSGWTFTKVFIFDLIIILAALVLRMYIMIAPGA